MNIEAVLRVAGFAAVFTCTVFAGPQYYLFDGDGQVGYQLDPGAATVVNTFPTFAIGYPIAIVGDKLRLGDRDDGSGREYDLNGVFTGVTFAGGSAFSELLDGTTDGTYNYGVECCGGTNSVMRADLFWQSGISLFTLPTHGTGITYDSALGTLWIAFFDKTIRQYSLSGTELSQFSVPEVGSALAYEAATDTLWIHPRLGAAAPNSVEQYSKTGTLLQTVVLPTWSPSNVWGGEIVNSTVPEPGTFAMLGLGLAVAGLARRRFTTA
jgi:hypothetical protein